jgi:hypothetical protein
MAAAIPRLELAFRIRVNMGERQRFGPVPIGSVRGFTGASGGIIEGPKLQGRVVPGSGGDFPLFRPDGVVELSAHYLLEASDGTKIYIHNVGYRHASPEVNERMRLNQVVDSSEYYFRFTPKFDVPIGPHDWLARTIFVGTADRREDHSVFDYYEVL